MTAPSEKPAAGPESYGFLLYLGLILGAVGAWALYSWTRSGEDVTDLKRYSALGAVASGVLFCYLSSLPKEDALAWVRSGAAALVVAFVFRWAVGEPYRIPSPSMEPTLLGDDRAFRGDRVWVNKWWYGVKWPFSNTRIFHLHAPQRWDIVVFNSVEKDAKHPVLVKRIAGLPGERIQIRGGKLYVNGEPIPLGPGMETVEYTSGSWQMKYGVDPADEHAIVPPGHYLVLGDNSSNSRDGRYFGWLPSENIVGRVNCVWWPISSWKDFTGFTRTLMWRGVVGLLVLWILVRLFAGRSYPAYAADQKTIDHYWVNFLAYGLRIPFLARYALRWALPQRGDLVLYEIKGDGIPPGALVAARVAGLPGESVSLVGGQWTINGAPLDAKAWPTVSVYTLGGGPVAPIEPRYTEVTLRAQEYFLLADDPADPEPYDSRVLGAAPLSAIQGRIICRWWPRHRMQRM